MKKDDFKLLCKIVALSPIIAILAIYKGYLTFCVKDYKCTKCGHEFNKKTSNIPVIENTLYKDGYGTIRWVKGCPKCEEVINES